MRGVILFLAEGGREPLSHVEEDVCVALQSHGVIQQVQSSKSPQAIYETSLHSFVDLFWGVFGLKQTEDSNRCRLRVKLTFSSKIDDCSFSHLNFLPLLETVCPVIFAVLLLVCLLTVDQDVLNLSRLLHLFMDNARYLRSQTAPELFTFLGLVRSRHLKFD